MCSRAPPLLAPFPGAACLSLPVVTIPFPISHLAFTPRKFASTQGFLHPGDAAGLTEGRHVHEVSSALCSGRWRFALGGVMRYRGRLTLEMLLAGRISTLPSFAHKAASLKPSSRAHTHTTRLNAVRMTPSVAILHSGAVNVSASSGTQANQLACMPTLPHVLRQRRS